MVDQPEADRVHIIRFELQEEIIQTSRQAQVDESPNLQFLGCLVLEFDKLAHPMLKAERVIIFELNVF